MFWVLGFRSIHKNLIQEFRKGKERGQGIQPDSTRIQPRERKGGKDLGVAEEFELWNNFLNNFD